MSDPRFVCCPLCDGQAVIASGTYYDFHQGPSVIEEQCPECEGFGSVEMECEPIELCDLEEIHAR